jgi:hypothetical protein
VSKCDKKLTHLLIALLLLGVSIYHSALVSVRAVTPRQLANGTFPIGTLVVTVDGKQADRLHVFGFIHELLRDNPNLEVARVIEPPDVRMQTALTPSGAIYQGGPFLIDQKFSTQVNAVLLSPTFKYVTATRLTAPFTSNQLFFVREPSILVIEGILGRSDILLDQMKMNYTVVSPDYVLAEPSIINQYSLIVLDSPGWYGNTSAFTPGKQVLVQAAYNTLRTQTQAGAEVIFTDIALKDLNQTFPGYVQLLGPNGPGAWASEIHNPPAPAGTFHAEYPSQYYNAGPDPNAITLVTAGGGFAVASVNPAHTSDVRILMDSTKFGVPFRYAILGFYFQFGNGIVEGLGFHPQDQLPVGSLGFYAVEQVYGNRFLRGPQVDSILAATPPVITVQAGNSATYRVTATSISSFSSQINFQVTGLPPSSSPSFSPTSVTPSASGTVSTQLTISTSQNTPIGTYNLTITGTSLLPAIIRTTTVQLIVNVLPKYGFAIDVIPFIQTLCPGEFRNFTIVVRSMNGWSGPVNLSVSGLPGGSAVNLTPSVVTPPADRTANATLTMSMSANLPVGRYPIGISGQSGAEFHALWISIIPCIVEVSGFEVGVSPEVVEIAQGTWGVATVSITALPFWSVASYNLTGSGNPPGMSLVFSPNPLMVQPQQTESSTLTISISKNVPLGNYTINISAISGAIIQNKSILVRVVPPHCIIATAAYGSELAVPVQFLRAFRDHDVDSTRLGRAFLTAFNAWYYSWAPPIAQTIANSNENVKSSIRILIAPLIASLFVAHGVFQNTVALNPEVAILLAGFVASALIGVMYLTLPMTILMYRNRRGTRYLLAVVAIVGLILALSGTIMHGSTDLMKVSTGILVIQTILLTPTALAKRIVDIGKFQKVSINWIQIHQTAL